MLLGAAGRIRGDWLKFKINDLEAAKAEGYNALNLIVTDPGNVRDQDVARTKRLFAEASLEISQTNGRYGGALVSEDEDERAAAIKFVKRTVNLTARLGSPNTYLRPGSLNPGGPWLPHPENRSDEVFDRLVDSAKQICKVAENEGIKVSTEGGVVCPVHSARRMRDFIDAVGSKSLGFNQDPVNFISSLDDVYNIEAFLQEFFDLLGHVTFGAHAKDFTVVDSLLVHFAETEIGSGLIPHDYFLAQMQKHAPNTHVLIEHLPPDRFANAIKNFMIYSEKAGISWDSPRPPKG